MATALPTNVEIVEYRRLYVDRTCLTVSEEYMRELTVLAASHCRCKLREYALRRIESEFTVVDTDQSITSVRIHSSDRYGVLQNSDRAALVISVGIYTLIVSLFEIFSGAEECPPPVLFCSLASDRVHNVLDM
jgi:hypothetical protein